MTMRRETGAAPPRDEAKAAATREAKGAAQEAIGKLIGDDAARARGSAEKKAGAADASRAGKPLKP